MCYCCKGLTTVGVCSVTFRVIWRPVCHFVSKDTLLRVPVASHKDVIYFPYVILAKSCPVKFLGSYVS